MSLTEREKEIAQEFGIPLRDADDFLSRIRDKQEAVAVIRSVVGRGDLVSRMVWSWRWCEMNKPVVIDRPWWRHPIFPWGWHSLRKDIPPANGTEVTLSGYYCPGDNRASGTYVMRSTAAEDDNGVVFVPLGGDGSAWVRDYDLEEWSDKGFAIQGIKEQPFF